MSTINKHNNKKIALIIIGLGLVVLLTGLVIVKYHKNKSVIPSVALHASSNEASKMNSSFVSSNNNDNGSKTIASTPKSQSDSSTTTRSSSSTPPAIPTGTFVSNHRPGVGSPTLEVSVCNTTVGATCYIEFSMGSNVRRLSSQIVGASGSVIWQWDAGSASTGLTIGSWSISAIATLNGQTRSSTDQLSMEIK